LSAFAASFSAARFDRGFGYASCGLPVRTVRQIVALDHRLTLGPRARRRNDHQLATSAKRRDA
jgi:hypothetical protein